ncbi:unnamed protein product, partial [Linum tenue]
ILPPSVPPPLLLRRPNRQQPTSSSPASQEAAAEAGVHQGPPHQGRRTRPPDPDARRLRRPGVPAHPGARPQVRRRDHPVAAPPGRARRPRRHRHRHHPRQLRLPQHLPPHLRRLLHPLRPPPPHLLLLLLLPLPLRRLPPPDDGCGGGGGGREHELLAAVEQRRGDTGGTEWRRRFVSGYVLDDERVG